ncbi:50S ribosomal protein L7/L12-serine acetyltransferase [Superficieibacter electus]|uniref:50S ribosomal protein L7/L12-serine acetyltransferase n=1 Tax=Superficieibacter electus TaxID=2022662 RepID=A0A2P5GUT6_9ENTR|nr:50S ribosomal protein L7/L12-serine acetyltransferase [Superficieibacter electus]POP44297.1 50S ribosomal protein L7/L12-serine acetyltransferase [Superficieibacter electus]POP50315.1 50S ribosomal protein L7/L12-serine acetyltransferase [Superficieibacter electus]
MKASPVNTPDIIPVNDAISLRAVDEIFVAPLYQLTLKNKAWLQQTLNWPQFVNEEADTRQTVQGNVMLHQRGYAKMYLIFHHEALIGVLSFNLIEPLNKTAYIGYWLDEDAQGQGIVSRSLQALMQHYVERGELRRFVIKCRVDNASSNALAVRNGFSLEGCLKQAEYLNGAYDDQNIYARIFSE